MRLVQAPLSYSGDRLNAWFSQAQSLMSGHMMVGWMGSLGFPHGRIRR